MLVHYNEGNTFGCLWYINHISYTTVFDYSLNPLALYHDIMDGNCTVARLKYVFSKTSS